MIGTVEERIRELNSLVPDWTGDTLWTRLEKAAALYPDRTYIVFENSERTYKQVVEDVERTAKALYYAGIRAGEHVAAHLWNRDEYIDLIFALSRIGAVRVPLNAGMKTEELVYTLDQSDAVCLFTADEEAASDCAGKYIRMAVVLSSKPGTDKPEKIKSATDPFVIPWEEFISKSRCVDELPRTTQDPQGLSDIMFTSGSTSRPKGVMMTNDMVLRTAFATCCTRRMEEGRRMLVPIPLFHAFAYVEGLLAALFIGGTVIFSEERFSTSHIVELMKQYRANDLICVSLIVTNILIREDIQPSDFPHLHAGYWASHCPAWVWTEARKRFGINDVVTSYGMTECGSTAAMLSPEDTADKTGKCNGKIKFAGAASCNNKGMQLEAKITDPGSGRILTSGSAGELCLKGPTITPGYYNNTEATVSAFDDEGWFHTGDICSFDEEGYLKFEGRISEMYKINGENVSPRFVEDVIGKCPAVRAVAVTGIPDEVHGEVGCAFVDCATEANDPEERIREYCRKHLGKYQVPEHIIILDQSKWPNTASGKLSRKALKDLAIQILSSH